MFRTIFSTSVVSAGATAIVIVRGELDLATAPELDLVLTSCLDEGYAAVDVDLQGVTFMACAGINVLLRHRVAAAGRQISVVRPSHVAARLLTLARVTALLKPDDLPLLEPTATPA